MTAMLDAVVERFLGESPLTVMARLVLERACNPAWVDAIFEDSRERQYQRQLLFSDVVDRMGVVVLGLRPSLHAALQRHPVNASVQAFYKKVSHTEPRVQRALVQGSYGQLSPVRREVEALRRKVAPPLCEGMPVRVVDGNDLPASDKRVKPLRGFTGAALPGQSLVVYSPDEDLVVDVLPWQDAFAQEAALLKHLLAQLQPGELWIADRAFSTRPILRAFAAKEAYALVREKSTCPVPREEGPMRHVGTIEAGEVYEQSVSIPDEEGGMLHLRRIELRLYEPTENGETFIRLLTNVPASRKAATILARLYKSRWKIEGLFGRLEAALESELQGLGQPKSALFAFCVALVAYNVLSVLQAAVEAAHEEVVEEQPISTFYMAAELGEYYGGLKVAVAPEAWTPYQGMGPSQLALTLVQMARRVNPAHLKKHPRGPKPKKPHRKLTKRQLRRQVATSRVLAAGTVDYPKRRG
jgi:hypothetical protein